MRQALKAAIAFVGVSLALILSASKVHAQSRPDVYRLVPGLSQKIHQLEAEKDVEKRIRLLVSLRAEVARVGESLLDSPDAFVEVDRLSMALEKLRPPLSAASCPGIRDSLIVLFEPMHDEPPLERLPRAARAALAVHAALCR